MHQIEECPHNETFVHIAKTLDRLDEHTLRSAVAMEEIAKQGILIASHEKRLDGHQKDLREAFIRVKALEQTAALDSDMTAVRSRVEIIELWHAKELGAEEVVEKEKTFWNGIKQQLAPYLLTAGIFAVLVFDKLDIGGKLAKLWHEVMK